MMDSGQKQKFQFTQEGYEDLKKELEKHLNRRPQVVINLTNAREQGDLSENAGYHAAKEELGHIDSRIKELKYLLRLGEVVKSRGASVVTFGNTVTLHDGQKEISFTLVERLEANPAAGKISTGSPIGKALLGKSLGDKFEVETPAGKISFKITKIS